jgi:hypothetical protein
MADLSKFKRKSSLGAPPPVTEASSNLEAPEIAPVEPTPKRMPPAKVSEPPRREGRRERDGRSARRTGRTIQFATRVSLEFDDRLRAIAEREGLLLVEVLERALDAYEANRSV